MFKKFVIAAGVLAALGSNGALAGGSSSVTVLGSGLNVTATVQASCTVAPTVAVLFGTISIVPGATATPGAFVVTCDNGTDYAVGLGLGNHHAATRQMASLGGALLPYELYTDNTFAVGKIFQDVVQGNATGTSAPVGTVGATGIGGAQTYGVFAQIPAGTPKPVPGSYTDSVSVTLVY